MTRVYPLNGNDPPHQNQQIHILAIGVDDYPHLQSTARSSNLSSVQFNPALLGLPPLSSPVVSAQTFVDWFVRTYTNPAQVTPTFKLGTVELLLSNGAYDGKQIDSANLANVKKAFNEWEARCDQSDDNLAIFYFCGHGIETSDKRTLLLPDNFGEYPSNLWTDAIDWGTTRIGMYDCRAQTQWYFLDCCREAPVLAAYNTHANRSMGTPLKSRITNRPEPEISQAFKACGEGQTAHGPANATSYFTTALLECLERFGVSHHDGDKWVVVTDSIADALQRRMQRVTIPGGAKGQCDIRDWVGGSAKEIYRLPKAEVMAEIDCDPTDANEYVRITLTDRAKQKRYHGPKAGAMKLDLPADERYLIEAKIVNKPSPYTKCISLKSQLVTPRVFAKKVQVQ